MFDATATSTDCSPTRIGAPYVFVEIDDLLSSPPDGVEVSNVVEVDLAGVPTTRFDLTIGKDKDCSADEPCNFAWETNWGFAQVLHPHQLHRVWWLDAPGAQRMITATDSTQDHIDKSTAIVESATAPGS